MVLEIVVALRDFLLCAFRALFLVLCHGAMARVLMSVIRSEISCSHFGVFARFDVLEGYVRFMNGVPVVQYPSWVGGERK